MKGVLLGPGSQVARGGMRPRGPTARSGLSGRGSWVALWEQGKLLGCNQVGGQWLVLSAARGSCSAVRGSRKWPTEATVGAKARGAVTWARVAVMEWTWLHCPQV